MNHEQAPHEEVLTQMEREARVQALVKRERELTEEMRIVDRAPSRWVPNARRSRESFDHSRKSDLAELDRVRAEIQALGGTPNEATPGDEEGD